ncbi:hypothetical protein DI005_27060 [Prauserella sp. PE36]|uniref:hypothetical protein n=1 Tax=Prauserella sp. PE36 TaxID=1504709 RepID=UPI000D8F55CA|nr:hypothetical protein [Prauserella sp. PE36]PXY20435.1 hypothetical protein BAY59_31910 [Prauserella coralliicola]RBM15946.1 hypothetical protein DI005_27060 [Prauserella sp. PE36]
MTDPDPLCPAWRRAVTGEVCWLDGTGEPRALAVTPVVDGAVACVALPYARAEEAASLRGARRVAFTVTDSRSLRVGAAGGAWFGTPSVTDDTSGEFFTEELLTQELVKYPPSRTLADSPLLCRENWWWLPRIIVRLRRVEPRHTLPARTDAGRHALVVRERSAALAVDVVDVADAAGERVVLRGLAGEPLRGDGTRALVFGHDYSMPDLERWEPWSLSGTLWGDELTVTERRGVPGGPLTPLRLVDRLLRQRALAKGCRRNILAAEQGI